MLQQPRSQEETPCTNTQEVPGIPFSTREENQANPLLYSSRERSSPPIKPSTQDGAWKP